MQWFSHVFELHFLSPILLAFFYQASFSVANARHRAKLLGLLGDKIFIQVMSKWQFQNAEGRRLTLSGIVWGHIDCHRWLPFCVWTLVWICFSFVLFLLVLLRCCGWVNMVVLTTVFIILKIIGNMNIIVSSLLNFWLKYILLLSNLTYCL